MEYDSNGWITLIKSLSFSLIIIDLSEKCDQIIEKIKPNVKVYDVKFEIYNEISYFKANIGVNFCLIMMKYL